MAITLRPLFFVLVFSCFRILSVEGGETPLAFADHLYSSGYYQEAAVEYKRVCFENPDSDQWVYARMQTARAYLRAGKTEDGWAIFDELIHLQDDRDVPATLPQEFATSLYHDQRYRSALTYLSQGTESNPELTSIRDLCFLRLGLVDDVQTHELITLYSNLPQKSPLAAGLFSALLPGSGQLYVERPRDAFWAFILPTLFAGLAGYAFDQGEDVSGILTGGLALVWYGGNIFNAVHGADLYNQNERELFFNQVEEGQMDFPGASFFPLFFSREF